MIGGLVKQVKGMMQKRDIPIILWGLITLLIVLGLVSPNSVKPAHLLDFTRQAAPMILASIGQTIVMLIGGLDLSVAAVMVLVDVVAAQMMMNDPSKALPVALFCICIGAVIGLVNGLLCAVLHMPSFVVTLGMSTLLLGVTLLYSGGSPKGSIPDNFRFLGTGFAGGIPMAAIVWAVITVLVVLMMKFLPIGRYIVATGVNPMAVYQSGVDHVRIQLLCYMLCGVFAALAGLQISAYIGTASLQLGEDYQTRSIAVALLGGAAFTGGKGSISGTVAASLFMVVMSSLVAVLHMDGGDQSIIQGIIILAGLLLSSLKKDD
ncbi:ABC transporter permease [Butyricicoccus faecihominis]|uniref:ABC transporter permease n=1 Tax=Butyricicoccus faecihominis TaxID=1712515 RepID=UPI00247904AE|nr:ABC transporter permease [Butyricicoccus faecihominis]MCQ5130162.1 ABC transporter permease [Butyricicoccus faecihominis]